MLREQGEQPGSKGSELALQVYGSMHIWLHTYMAPCIYSSMRIRCCAYTVLTPLASSSLPHSSSLPACSPISSLLPAHPLVPCHPEVVGIPIHTKLLLAIRSQLGASWRELEPAGSEGSSRDPGILREQGEQPGVSWGLPEA